MNSDGNIKIPVCGIIGHGDAEMKINSIDIHGIGGIGELEIKFGDKLNVICGANGIGKSTILDIILDAFIRDRALTHIKRNAKYDVGSYEIIYQTEEKVNTFSRKVQSFTPQEKEDSMNLNNSVAKLIMNFNINRGIEYDELKSIPRDPRRDLVSMNQALSHGINFKDAKGWFVNRFLYMPQDVLSSTQIDNYNEAKEIFGLLDSKTSFKQVDPRTNDIIVTTPNGDILFEYLSAGYKTCIFMLMGIIKELEFRFEDMKFKDFNGVITIDEVDLHLHPTWQAKIVTVFKETFPNAQIIMTTHSPSILQTLEKDEILPLTYDEQGRTVIKELNLGQYGLQGWTLEEILTDIMEMPATSSELYKQTINNFDSALNDENQEDIIKNYKVLLEILHPTNKLRQLLKIQVAEWED